MPTHNRSGQVVLSRFEARNRLDKIRDAIRVGFTKQAQGASGEVISLLSVERELDLAALDTCEAALETLGD